MRFIFIFYQDHNAQHHAPNEVTVTPDGEPPEKSLCDRKTVSVLSQASSVLQMITISSRGRPTYTEYNVPLDALQCECICSTWHTYCRLNSLQK